MKQVMTIADLHEMVVEQEFEEPSETVNILSEEPEAQVEVKEEVKETKKEKTKKEEKKSEDKK